MKKCLQTLIIGFLLILVMPIAKLSAQVSTWDGTWEPWTHGSGTEADPFLIENAQQLAYLAYRVNNGLDAGGTHISNHDYYRLMVDVNLNGNEDLQWVPIGYWNSDIDFQCFGGQFDGNNHIIIGMYIKSSANRVGFCGFTNGAIIQNLSILGDTIATTGQYAGGFVGVSIETAFINCDNFCSISSIYTTYGYSYSFSGGIVGLTRGNTTIVNCHNSKTIYSRANNYMNYEAGNAFSYSGGIVGRINDNATNETTIVNCYNTGNISADTYSHYLTSPCSSSGGLVGESNFTNIINSYNTGSVFSNNYSGGIVGQCCNSTNITNNYNSGSLSYNNYYIGGTGGIIGNGTSNISNSYFLNTCGGDNTNGGTPLTDDALKSMEFINIINDGSEVYRQDIYNVNQGYPIFSDVPYVSTTTSYSINITQTQATICGNTYSTENNIQCGFEYKKTSDSNYQAVTVTGSGDISKTLIDLIPNTKYTFKTFCKTDNNKTYYGEEKTFTTLPVSVTTYTATNVTATSATLHGSMIIGDATLSSKGFEYRISGEPNYTTINVSGNDNDFTAQLSGLQTNNTYEYRAFMNIAEDATTYYGDTKTFTVSWFNQDTIFVNNAETLHWVADQCNSGTTFQGKCIMLTNDITLPLNVPNNMVSIGSYPDHPFKGSFDGNGKLIYNLYIDQPNTPYQGFFGYTLNANLYNVGLVNITASGRNYTGGMVAYAENTHMRDCYVNGGTLYALSYCGGLVGYQEQGTNSIISGCYNTCTVSGNHYVGGLVGFSNYGTVRNSYVTAPVSGQGNAIGAIIGGANEVLMYNCYFSTEITGQTEAIGENNFKGGEGLTNAQMRDPKFVNTMNQGLVTPVWKADYKFHINNGFPILIWQGSGNDVEENNVAKNCISLYPNPANDFVTIKSDDPSVSLLQAEVYDVNGRKMMSEVLDGQSKGFGISKLQKGIYNVRIQTSNGYWISLKLVVQ